MGFFGNIINRLTNAGAGYSRIQMVKETGEGFYSWNGKLYQSDIVRACIRPKTQAIGKIVGKHIQETVKKGKPDLKINPEPYIKYLLQEPNPYMTGQMLQEKLANQLALNNNAFALLIRDENGYPMEIYPIPAVTAEAKYGKDGELYLRFTFLNGKSNTFAYSDILHLRRDFYDQDIFGSSQVQALSGIMNVIGTLDQGIVKAIKNSSVIRWLLVAKSSVRPEDLKRNVKEFVDNYLSVESDTFGAAGVDAKFDAKQITPNDVVPNFKLTEQQIGRVYSFFNTNEKIVNSSYTEEEWNSYYEAEIEPVVVQFSDVWTQRLFTRRERSCGNRIEFESVNLQCASIKTKLDLQAMVDRGAMTPNEWRHTLNLSPLPGGDQPIRRLDTQVVGMVETLIDKMDATNYSTITAMIHDLLQAAGEKKPLQLEDKEEVRVDAKSVC